MIELNLQLFAKSAAYQQGRRKSQAISKYSYESQRHSSAGGQPREVNKPEPAQQPQRAKSRSAKGESVKAVNKRETYEIYLIDRGKEVYVKDREGSVIVEKMIYIPTRDAWVSKAKGEKRYKIRRKVR